MRCLLCYRMILLPAFSAAQMMAFPGGKDRTAAEWRALLADAGWRLERIVPLRGMDSVVVGAPAST